MFAKRLPFILLSLSVGACAAPPTDGEPGDREDSFGTPTEHGELRFGVPNRATFTDDQTFHSWTFELTDTADIDLLTEIDDNVDTVLFLYRRDPGEKNFGPNIAKNDDHADSLGSRITVDNAKAGEYRIKVKAAKVLIRGDFAVSATCAGAGCPASGNSGQFEPLPKEGMTEECISTFVNAVSAPITSSAGAQEVEFPDPDLSRLDPLELKAVGHFVAYWDDVAGFEDEFGSDAVLQVELEKTEQGAIVDVDGPGDETAITFVYDENGDLIALYQHNQSPETRWYCGLGSKTDTPDEECTIDTIRHMAHAAETSTDTQTTLGQIRATTMDPRVKRAVDAYEEEAQLNLDTRFTLFATLWGEPGEARGAEIAFDGPHLVTYFIAAPTSGPVRLMASLNEDGEGLFICE